MVFNKDTSKDYRIFLEVQESKTLWHYARKKNELVVW